MERTFTTVMTKKLNLVSGKLPKVIVNEFDLIVTLKTKFNSNLKESTVSGMSLSARNTSTSPVRYHTFNFFFYIQGDLVKL